MPPTGCKTSAPCDWEKHATGKSHLFRLFVVVESMFSTMFIGFLSYKGSHVGENPGLFHHRSDGAFEDGPSGRLLG